MGDERTGEGHALTLAPGHGEPAVADDAAEATELVDHLFGAGHSHCVEQALVGDLTPRAEQEVVAKTRGKEQWLLRYDADGAAELIRVELEELDAVERSSSEIGRGKT